MTVRTRERDPRLALALIGLALLAGGEALSLCWPGLAAYRALTLSWGLALLLGAGTLSIDAGK